jgi:hypothetical protein
MKKIFHIIIIVLLSTKTYAQIDPKTIGQRITDATYIFEGEVIKTNPYETSDEKKIYTSNTIKITKIFKGDIQCGTIEIITLGGIVNNKGAEYSHNKEFGKGQIGVFLCKQTDREISAVDFYPENNPNKLELNYNQQGFIQYFNDGVNKQVVDMWSSLDSLSQIYGLIEVYAQLNFIDCYPTQSVWQATGNHESMQLAIHNANNHKKSKSKFIPANFVNNIFEDLEVLPSISGTDTLWHKLDSVQITGTTNKFLEFDVLIKSNVVGYVSSDHVFLNYNTNIHGTYIASNQNIQVTLNNNYDTLKYGLDVSDIIPNRVRFGISQDQSVIALTPLTTQYSKIYHVKMVMNNCGGSPFLECLPQGISGWNANCPDSNFYSTHYSYDVIVGDTIVLPQPNCPIFIGSFAPLQVNAGVNDTVTVYGNKFGTYGSNSKVYLRDADIETSTFLQLDSSNIVSWTNLRIKFTVPSYTFNPIQYYHGAGTGHINVVNDSNQTATSENILKINYSISNQIWTDTIRINDLSDGIDTAYQTGYLLYVDTSIANYPIRYNSLKKAVRSWNCLTNVNFKIGPTISSPNTGAINDNACVIQFGSVPNGSNAHTVKSKRSTLICLQNSIHVFTESFDIILNKDLVNDFVFDTIVTNNIPPDKIDGYRTLMHELGHAHSLDHVIDSSKVMHGFALSGATAENRTVKLSTDNPAKLGGQFIMNRALSPNILPPNCVITPMTPIIPQSCFEFDYSDVFDINIDNKIIAFPNPATNELNLVFPTSNNLTEVSIFNSNGSLTYKSSFKNNAVINTQEFSRGIYFIQASSVNYHASKIIILK